MDSHDVLFDCSAWTEERREMLRMYEEDSGGEPRKVRQFISSRKATPAVLGFIASRASRKESAEIGTGAEEKGKGERRGMEPGSG